MPKADRVHSTPPTNTPISQVAAWNMVNIETQRRRIIEEFDRLSPPPAACGACWHQNNSGEPAMSDNIVDFPLSDRPIAETDIEALHAEAFRDLENRLNDCVSVARIAAEQMPQNQ
jgi:hypothetical protein